MRVHFVTACRNVSRNAAAITRSLAEQTSDRWLWSVVDDASSDDTSDAFAYEAHNQGVSRVSITRSDERKHALRNIVETVRASVEPGDIVATLDGDDALCNPRTVEILLEAYSTPTNDVVWTSHRWDTNGMNISRAMPDRVDPYAWPWVTSHLRTFRADLLSRVSDENFKDTRGEWFKRGYDGPNASCPRSGQGKGAHSRGVLPVQHRLLVDSCRRERLVRGGTDLHRKHCPCPRFS